MSLGPPMAARPCVLARSIGGLASVANHVNTKPRGHRGEESGCHRLLHADPPRQ